MPTTTKIRFGDNLAVTDEGGGVIRVDASAIAEVGGGGSSYTLQPPRFVIATLNGLTVPGDDSVYFVNFSTGGVRTNDVSSIPEYASAEGGGIAATTAWSGDNFARADDGTSAFRIKSTRGGPYLLTVRVGFRVLGSPGKVDFNVIAPPNTYMSAGRGWSTPHTFAAGEIVFFNWTIPTLIQSLAEPVGTDIKVAIHQNSGEVSQASNSSVQVMAIRLYDNLVAG